MDEKIGGISMDEIMAAAMAGMDDENDEPVIVKEPEPIVSKPVEPEPIVSKPVEPEPIVSKPVEPEPALIVPVELEPIVSKPVEPEPVVSKPIEPGPIEPISKIDNQIDDSEEWNIGLIGGGQGVTPSPIVTPDAGGSAAVTTNQGSGAGIVDTGAGMTGGSAGVFDNGAGIIGGGAGIIGGGAGIIGGGVAPAGEASISKNGPDSVVTGTDQPGQGPIIIKQGPEIQMRDFKCSRCGSPLKIPRNSKGVVVCPYCKNESVIEGLVKNAEIADKENINSGISLDADISVLHNITVNAMIDSVLMPLDILDKATVIKEERYCVPAYMYYCNGTTSYSYDAGNIREHKTAIDLGDKTRVEKEQYVEWTQMTGMASTSATLIAPGNREFAPIIERLYMDYSPSDLIDVEELEYPHDVETYSYNLPQSAAFNEYIRPVMEELLLEKAEESLRGRRYRNLSAGGGSNIQKDEIIRLFLGIYRIVYVYEGMEYCIYVTGDGKHYTYDNSPIDAQRQGRHSELTQQLDEINAKNEKLKKAMKYSAIAAIFTLGISLIITIICGVLYFQNKKNIAEPKAQELADFNSQRDQAIAEFEASHKSLQGIYNIN